MGYPGARPFPGWWPTQSTPHREEFVGPERCAECHTSEAAVQETTPMAKAGTLAANSKISPRTSG